MVATTPAVTFLFTDIEGSTKLWETEPVRMADGLARHDRLCRGSVEAHGGRYVKTTGDGLHAVFGDPSAAVAAVIELQRGMAAIAADCGLPFKIRCGLHTGAAQERDGDYFGSAVNRAARIMSAAHGGQVLLSQSVVDLGQGRFPDDTDLLHLGRVRLRDLSAPEDVWQLLHADLPRTFPALRSLDSTPNNLTQQPTSFIGREKEIAGIKELLGKTRLLTLTGSGGCGKTRLAVQVAADLLESYADGVWVAELAAVADPALVPQTVTTILGLREEPGKSLTQTLTDHLKSRRSLLVLDNAEHLLAACAQLADAVLRQCPQVVVLVSSREALGIGGELTYRVPSLSIPDPKLDITVELLSQYESARLFVERAQSRLPQFTVTPQNAPALASVCSRLDGIPLAIELAAARVRSLSVEEVNARLDQRFRFLTGGSRTALPRQQTLRSLIDWSYDLLNETEQALLCRVAVFAGGWTLEGIEQVCVGAGIDDGEVLDVLTSLADKSLVVAEERQGATRYRLLETVRQYARDRLLESGDGGQWRDRHLAYFLAVAEEGDAHLQGADQQVWLDRLETEHDNLRGGLTWSAAAGGDAAGGLRLAGALWRFWSVRGYLGEGRGWLSGLLAAAPGGQAAAARAKALNAAGVLASQQGDDSAARALFEETLAIRRELGDRRGIGYALNNLGLVAYHHSDYLAAIALYEESLAVQREIGDQWGIALALNNLGSAVREQGDYPAAQTLLEAGLAIVRDLGDRLGIASSLNNLGDVADAQGDHASARALYEESLAIFRELGDRRGITDALTNLGTLASHQGDYSAARELYAESLVIARELGYRVSIAHTLNNLGLVAYERGDYLAAIALYEESLAVQREMGDRVGIASSLEGLAYVAFARAEPGRAGRIWAGAERLREEIGCPLPPSDRPRYERQVAAARAAIGDDAAFDRAWQEGRTMTPEQFIDYVLEERVADG